MCYNKIKVGDKMTQFLGALLLTGVLGYIPYKYLTMIGLVSEKTRLSILLYY